jgi:hypothetical protein
MALCVPACDADVGGGTRGRRLKAPETRALHETGRYASPGHGPGAQGLTTAFDDV